MKSKIIKILLIAIIIGMGAYFFSRWNIDRNVSPKGTLQPTPRVIQFEPYIIPSTFPKDIPVEAGSKPLKSFFAELADGMTSTVRSFQSTKSVQANFDFYKKWLTQNNWQILTESSDKSDKKSIFALDYFAHHFKKHLGSLVFSLNGLDALVLGGGMPRAPLMRKILLQDLENLGISIDHSKLKESAPVKISSSRSKVDVWVFETDEQQEMFELTQRI